MVRGGGGGTVTGTAPKEFIGAIRTKFIRLKQEVDSELGVFAGDLVGVLERGDMPEDGRLALEDLLVAAQRYAKMSPEEFWTRCEGIVQGLDDRLQELPAGFPKQAHTRILFIEKNLPARIFSSGDGAAGAAEQSPSGKMASWKKLPSPAEKNKSAGADAAPSAEEKNKPIITRPQGKPSVDEIVERVDAASIHPDGLYCTAAGSWRRQRR